jgi:cytochrome c oxidase subunit 2
VSRSAGGLRSLRPVRRDRLAPPRRLGRGALRAAALGVLLVVSTTGCEMSRFGYPKGITVQSKYLLRFWQGSVIASLAVGVFVWGLIFIAIIAFRRRASDELPRQVQYNLPVEILYTLVPVIIVVGLFYYTARDESREDRLTKNPGTVVQVVAFRWGWTFNTLRSDGRPVSLSVTGRPSQPAQLILPENRNIRFDLVSEDVVHSFWVPEFLFKRDVIPGRVNQFEVTINKTGTYVGRCAELCGVDHDRMNFSIKVLPEAQYDAFVATHSTLRQ